MSRNSRTGENGNILFRTLFMSRGVLRTRLECEVSCHISQRRKGSCLPQVTHRTNEVLSRQVQITCYLNTYRRYLGSLSGTQGREEARSPKALENLSRPRFPQPLPSLSRIGFLSTRLLIHLTSNLPYLTHARLFCRPNAPVKPRCSGIKMANVVPSLLPLTSSRVTSMPAFAKNLEVQVSPLPLQHHSALTTLHLDEQQGH